MKKLMLGVSLFSFLLVINLGQRSHAQDVTVSFQMFYDNLSPYGEWVYDPDYGYVWVPNEEGDFRPYGSRGYWAMTDFGNTWVSDDPWGWACYHYGRWTYDPYYGWVWIPGYEWAPAWVSWRYGNGFCGWAPLGPSVSISMGYNCPESWWVFVQPTYMYRRDCFNYWRGPSYNRTYIRQTTVINNYYVDNSTRVRYNYGPRREQVERITHQPVQVYSLSHNSRPGAPVIAGNRLNVYRPRVDRGTRENARPQEVIQAPRQIGRPQAANNMDRGRQPQFRQDIRQNPAMRQQMDRGRQNQQLDYQRQQEIDRGRQDQQRDMQRQQQTERDRQQQQRNNDMQRQQQMERDRQQQQRNNDMQRQQQMERDRQQQQRNNDMQRQQQMERDRQQQQRNNDMQRQQQMERDRQQQQRNNDMQRQQQMERDRRQQEQRVNEQRQQPQRYEPRQQQPQQQQAPRQQEDHARRGR